VNGFTQILNDLITDKRISATAYRVASYLGSKTEDWTAREHDVCDALGIGPKSYKTAMRQLVAAAYVSRGTTARDARGRIRTAPPALHRPSVVANHQVVPKVPNRPIGKGSSYSTLINNTSSPMAKTEGPSKPLGSGPNSSPGASDAAPAAERKGLRVSTCITCSEVIAHQGLKEHERSRFHEFHLKEESKCSNQR
jgi:hypothetical protein